MKKVSVWIVQIRDCDRISQFLFESRHDASLHACSRMADNDRRVDVEKYQFSVPRSLISYYPLTQDEIHARRELGAWMGVWIEPVGPREFALSWYSGHPCKHMLREKVWGEVPKTYRWQSGLFHPCVVPEKYPDCAIDAICKVVDDEIDFSKEVGK